MFEMRRHSLALLCLVAASVTGATNVLMLVIDDLRGEFGQSFGAPEVLTPAIDQLAARGTSFTRTFAQAPTCGVSRSSFLTGRRPDTTRVLENGGCPFTNDPSHKDWVSLPRWFKESNYTSIGAGKVFHPGVCSGLAVGEDPNAWDRYFHAPGPDGNQKKSCSNGSYLNGTCDSGKTRTLSLLSNSTLDNVDTPDGQVAQFAVDTLKSLRANSGKPFFLAVGLHKP
jgi:arylsulfatase A-like enzyme